MRYTVNRKYLGLEALSESITGYNKCPPFMLLHSRSRKE
jgi:hypothetical protein